MRKVYDLKTPCSLGAFRHPGLFYQLFLVFSFFVVQCFLVIIVLVVDPGRAPDVADMGDIGKEGVCMIQTTLSSDIFSRENVKISYTRDFLKVSSLSLRSELMEKSLKVIPLFPELDCDEIRFGCCYTAMANAQFSDLPLIKIGFNPKYSFVYYNTLGHELTHIAQRVGVGIPHGEKSCDVWTLARNDLFLDGPPGYLEIPRSILAEWKTMGSQVRKLCIQAIQIRETERRYIKWLEAQIAILKGGNS